MVKAKDNWDDKSVGIRHLAKEMSVCRKCGESTRRFFGLLRRKCLCKRKKKGTYDGAEHCRWCGDKIEGEYHTNPPDGDNPYYCSETCWGKGSNKE